MATHNLSDITPWSTRPAISLVLGIGVSVTYYPPPPMLSKTNVLTKLPSEKAPGIAGATVPPSVIFFPSTAISPDDTIQIDITDVTGLLDVVIQQIFSNIVEDIYDLSVDSFSPNYSPATKVPITNGYSFQFKRKGGWTSAPQIRVHAVNMGGLAT